MGLAAFNRMRRQRANLVKLEHNEAEKILTAHDYTNTDKAVELKNAEVMQDAADAEERKRKAKTTTVRGGDTIEETEKKNAFVMKDNGAAVKEREKAETTTVHDSDTPEETEAKSQLVMEDAEAAEKAKEEHGGPLSDPPVTDPRGDGETDPALIDNALPPVDPEDMTAKAETPKRSRKKADFNPL